MLPCYETSYICIFTLPVVSKEILEITLWLNINMARIKNSIIYVICLITYNTRYIVYKDCISLRIRKELNLGVTIILDFTCKHSHGKQIDFWIRINGFPNIE